jgi:hypothetical protein
MQGNIAEISPNHKSLVNNAIVDNLDRKLSL